MTVKALLIVDCLKVWADARLLSRGLYNIIYIACLFMCFIQIKF
jgi:hypothetical protein